MVQDRLKRPGAIAALGALALLAACDVPPTGTSAGATNAFPPAPEAVLAIAAPYQNLNAIRLDPNDNCYWYLYNGPVESTFLPLRTVNGNPICAKDPAAS